MRKTTFKWLSLILAIITTVALVASVFIFGNNSTNDNNDDSGSDIIYSSSSEASIDFSFGESSVISDAEVITGPQLNIPSNVFGDVPFVGLYTADTLKPIYEESANALLYPASMTKIVTACVTLKYVSPDDVVKVGSEQDLVHWDSSKCGIVKGQRLSIEHLLYGLMLPSGNDAAHTLAVYVARTVSGNEDLTDEEAVKSFAELMNDFCAEIGAMDTHFVNPEGWHSEEHFTTINDLAIMTQYAMTIPLIRDIVSCSFLEVRIASGHKMMFINSNPFLQKNSGYYNEYVTGMKTGSTSAAGKCLVTTINLMGNEYIAVVAGCGDNESRNKTTQALIDYAIEYNNLILE